MRRRKPCWCRSGYLHLDRSQPAIRAGFVHRPWRQRILPPGADFGTGGEIVRERREFAAHSLAVAHGDDDRRISGGLSILSAGPTFPKPWRATRTCSIGFCSTMVLRRNLRLPFGAAGTVAFRPSFWKGGDGFIIDGFGPDGVSARVLDVTRNVIRLQTGYLYHYAFAMLIGVAAAITWFMFAGPH